MCDIMLGWVAGNCELRALRRALIDKARTLTDILAQPVDAGSWVGPGLWIVSQSPNLI